jgi:hypothetical protein
LRFLIASVAFISLSNSDPKRADFSDQEREGGRKLKQKIEEQNKE